MSAGAHRIEAALAHVIAPDTDAGLIAEAGCATWRSFAAILSPIIGRLGVSALYKRSLHLTRAAHPWLPVHDDLADLQDFAALRVALSSQTAPDAAAANTALLATFYDILSTLIGASLTERLLGSVLDKPSTDLAAQDSTP